MSVLPLNPSQREAIAYTGGPLLIVAGAGTGKTEVITQKIAYLVNERGVLPEQILALTFTDKAAGEMEDRVSSLLSVGYANMQISTFHAFCQHLLERYGMDIGIPNRFRLLTQTDAWLLMRKNLYDFHLEYYRPLGNPGRHIAELLKHFGKCKDELVSPEEYMEYAQTFLLNQDAHSLADAGVQSEARRLGEVASAYHTYNQLLLKNNAMDFGGLLYYAILLLRQRPAILAALQKRFTHILVDEFQDVNWSQYALVGMLAGRGNLTVVGDDDQSIYAFRGASVSNILRFKEDFPQAKEIVLNTNYRSGQSVLDAAYRLIQHNNPNRLEVKLNINKKLSSEAAYASFDVRHIHCPSSDAECLFVADEIARLKRDTPEMVWDDVAILVRANGHAEPYIHALERAGIPYEFLASSGLYRQPIVMDCINFFKIVANQHEGAAMYRLLRMPVVHIREDDMQKILHAAKKKSITQYEAVHRAAEWHVSAEGIAVCDRMVGWVRDGMRFAREEKPTSVLYRFLEISGYLAYLAHEEGVGNRDVIRQLYQLQQFFDTVKAYEMAVPDSHLAGFLEHYDEIVVSGDDGRMSQPADTPDSVNILTVHAAKGLEFRYVFVVNLVEDRFPSRDRGDAIDLPMDLVKEQIPEGDHHIEEERRLLYVAMTRAKEVLYLTSAEDYGGIRKKKISRFLVELGYASVQHVSKEYAGVSHRLSPLPRPMHEEEMMTYEVPKTFSFSQVRSYQVCPYQYKLAHVIRIPHKGNWSFSFGTTMHTTLQKFYERVQVMNGLSQASLFGVPVEAERGTNANVRVPEETELIKLYEESWIPDFYEDKRQREEYYKKGMSILRLFYASHAGEWTVPVALESGFTIIVGGAVIRGKIDRIDIRPDGTIEIIDYKTGQSKETVSGDEKDQLLLYQIAAETLPEYQQIGAVGTLIFYYLNDNIKTSFRGTSSELDHLKNKIKKTIERIQSNDFSATPGAFVCGRCDFRDICEFRAI